MGLNGELLEEMAYCGAHFFRKFFKVNPADPSVFIELCSSKSDTISPIDGDSLISHFGHCAEPLNSSPTKTAQFR